MLIQSARFGTIDAPASATIEIVGGLRRHPFVTEGIIIAQRPDSVVVWLQALQQPTLAVPLVIPWIARPDYAFTVGLREQRLLETPDPTALAVYAPLSGSDDLHDAMIDLRHPLLVNEERRRACQMLAGVEGYGEEPLAGRGGAMPVAVRTTAPAHLVVLAA